MHTRVEPEEPGVMKDHGHPLKAPHSDRVETGSCSFEETTAKETEDEEEGEVGTTNSPRVSRSEMVELEIET